MESDTHIFADRKAAGVELARAVKKCNLLPPLLVLGLPRGGVPVAYEVARALEAPLDVMVVRKIGMPGQPELAIGAIATGNIVVRDPQVPSQLAALGLPFEELVNQARLELERREHAYRADLPPLDLRDKTVILVDDGLATGATMVAALRAARKVGTKRVIAAAPVASHEAMALTRREADECVFLQTPALLVSISQWYEHFEQLEDSEVRTLLERARRYGPPAHLRTSAS